MNIPPPPGHLVATGMPGNGCFSINPAERDRVGLRVYIIPS
ncbi:hypothetical protein [Parenemella sanctibonifatiensis]|nr:hypothetical protein [Parenemella sanctibonifatiensis]